MWRTIGLSDKEYSTTSAFWDYFMQQTVVEAKKIQYYRKVKSKEAEEAMETWNAESLVLC